MTPSLSGLCFDCVHLDNDLYTHSQRKTILLPFYFYPNRSYHLRVRRDMEESYLISKRYGQFEELHKKLKRTYNFDAIDRKSVV